MSRAYSLLFLLGILVLFATSSMARSLEEDDVAFLDSDVSESNDGVEDEDIWNIDSLKHHHHHRGGRHAHAPKQHRHRHRHAPPPHSHGPPKHHAPPPEESF